MSFQRFMRVQKNHYVQYTLYVCSKHAQCSLHISIKGELAIVRARFALRLRG